MLALFGREVVVLMTWHTGGPTRYGNIPPRQTFLLPQKNRISVKKRFRSTGQFCWRFRECVNHRALHRWSEITITLMNKPHNWLIIGLLINCAARRVFDSEDFSWSTKKTTVVKSWCYALKVQTECSLSARTFDLAEFLCNFPPLCNLFSYIRVLKAFRHI